MHSLQILLIQTATTPTTVAKSSSSKGSSYTLLIFVALIAVVYIFWLRPRGQKMRAQQTNARQLNVGDPVVTAGGIYGTVVALDSEVAEVEVAPGTVMTFMRRSVNPRLVPGPGAPASGSTGPVVDDKWDYPAESETSSDDHPAGSDTSPSDDTPSGPDEKSPS
jgi:preprotein translocase subunit YajC